MGASRSQLSATPRPHATVESQASLGGDGPFERDKYLLKQKHLSLTEKYAIFDDADHQLLFVRREAHHFKQIVALLAAVAAALVVGGAAIAAGSSLNARKYETLIMVLSILGVLAGIAAAIVVGIWLSPKRHIGFYTDQTMKREVLKVFQDQKMALINATYTVADSEYNLIGWFRKNYLYNIFRKRWYGYGADGNLICIVLEDSVLYSIMRRMLGRSGALIITNFIILKPDQDTKLGEFNRKFTLFDKYVLDLTFDRERTLDRRMALALGVLLDTAEKR